MVLMAGSAPSPDVAVDPVVAEDLFHVVVGFGERDVLGEDVRVVSTGESPVVDVAVARVVGRQGTVDRAVALQAGGQVVRAELDALFGMKQVGLVEVLQPQRGGYLGGGVRDDLGQTLRPSD